MSKQRTAKRKLKARKASERRAKLAKKREVAKAEKLRARDPRWWLGADPAGGKDRTGVTVTGRFDSGLLVINELVKQSLTEAQKKMAELFRAYGRRGRHSLLAGAKFWSNSEIKVKKLPPLSNGWDDWPLGGGPEV